MKKTILTAAVMLSALGFTSCLSSDGDNKHEATINYGGSYCFNHVTDIQSGETFISTEPQYSFNLNYTDQLITPSMSNIKLNGADAGSLAFKLPAFKVSVGTQDYSYACSGKDIIPEGQTQAYLFDNFNFKAIDRAIKTSNGTYIYSPVYDISYRINSRYDVMVIPTRYDLLGTTTATTDEAGSYSTKESIYTIVLDPKTGKASIGITDARFASDQTYMKIGVKDLIYEAKPYGITIKTEPGEKIQLRDTAGDVKGAYLSDINLRINIPSSRGSSLSFHANITGLQGSSPVTEFDVNANISYYIPTDGK